MSPRTAVSSSFDAKLLYQSTLKTSPEKKQDNQTLSRNILQKQTLVDEPVSVRPSVSTHELAWTVGLRDLGLVTQKRKQTQTSNTH